tara:strand:- start:4011 stop:4988 length:978 start_codon:yes stop_codon:yes gene_type:complete
MIGVRTPFRISFFGGGTDLPNFYRKNGGSVISTSINKYMYIFIHKYFTDQIQIKYSKTELANNFDQIKHPIVREILKKYKLSGVDINSIADIPSGTGLGSSSSFTVTLLNAVYTYIGQHVSHERLAKEASEIEIEILNEPIGKQDQYAASYGGFNRINFLKNGNVNVKRIPLNIEDIRELNDRLILFYYGNQRNASDILSEQNKKINSKITTQSTLKKMVKLVDEAEKYLIVKDFDNFGYLLNETWNLKKTLASNISDKKIDDIYKIGIDSGAYGGKLLGAGGGGFFLFYIRNEDRSKLINNLSSLKEFDFKFEDTGSTIIINNK